MWRIRRRNVFKNSWKISSSQKNLFWMRFWDFNYGVSRIEVESDSEIESRKCFEIMLVPTSPVVGPVTCSHKPRDYNLMWSRDHSSKTCSMSIYSQISNIQVNFKIYSWNCFPEPKIELNLGVVPLTATQLKILRLRVTESFSTLVQILYFSIKGTIINRNFCPDLVLLN